MPAKRSRPQTQPTDGGLTMRQAVALKLQAKVPDSLVSWKFGHASFETDKGKVFCFITREGHLAMKLPAERVAPLLDAGDVSPLRMGKRTMREWFVVPEPESPRTLRLLAEAKAYVTSLAAAKKPAKRKPAAKNA